MRLAEAWFALKQDMPTREECGEHLVDDGILPDEHAASPPGGCAG